MKQNGFTATVKKTRVVQVNKDVHNLPPDLGNFTEYKVADYHCPDEWSKDGVFIPVKEGDPMWFDFRGNDECAILVSVQRLNPVTGDPANLEKGLTKKDEQNYLSMPKQRWLDGYVNDGKVYQFVVTKHGIGLAVNEYVLPKHMQDSHALGFAFFAPKNPKPKPQPMPELQSWPPVPPVYDSWPHYRTWEYGGQGKFGSYSHLRGGGTSSRMCGNAAIGSTGMNNNAICRSGSGPNENNVADAEIFFCSADGGGEESYVDTVNILADQQQNLADLDKASMGQGGRIDQRIVSDENSVDYYHEKPDGTLIVYMALPEMFEAIMNKGKRQDSSRSDEFVHSGKVGGVQIPLISQEEK